MFRTRIQPWLPLLALLALLGVTAAAYLPGLGGPFLLDDWGTLPKLGAYGPVDNPLTLVSYLTSGNAGPTGRPLALASFLIDARNWPAPPWPFKFTNLLIHLFNGILLAFLLLRLSRTRGLDPPRAAWAGVLGAGLWLLHPLFVSTTLYVVQRMAELAATFVFAGLLAWLAGRERLARGRTRSGYALMLSGLLGGTFLGVLAKENAVLLPLLTLVLEATVLAAPAAHQPAPTRPWFGFRLLFLGLPAALVGAYLLGLLRHASRIIPFRGISIAERLLTEPRVLTHYLYLLVIPHVATGGLFTTPAPSRGWFEPWSTLPAIVLILGLIAFAWRTRRRWPALAAAILFYFAGQLLESTTIPLELYFEHRNYLPAALLFWPLGLWLVRSPGAGPRLRTGLAVGTLALLAGLTALRADLWGNRTLLLLSWMRQDPNSSRAIVRGTQTLVEQGHPLAALAILRRDSARLPEDISIGLMRLSTACALGRATPADLAAARRAAVTSRAGSSLIYQAVQRLERQMARHRCAPFDTADMLALARAALANPNFSHDPALRQEFTILEGRLYLDAGNIPAAYEHFAAALPLYVKPDVALVTASLLGAADAPRRGLALLNEYRQLHPLPPRGWTMRRLHRWWLERSGWYRDSFRHVRRLLESSARKPA